MKQEILISMDHWIRAIPTEGCNPGEGSSHSLQTISGEELGCAASAARIPSDRGPWGLYAAYTAEQRWCHLACSALPAIGFGSATNPWPNIQVSHNSPTEIRAKGITNGFI